MQGLEGLLKGVTGNLINSGLGMADKFTGGLVTGAGDAICNLLGICDKPIDPVSAGPIINKTVAPLCHGAGLDRSIRLGLSPLSQTDTTPAVLGAIDSDFDITTLCKIPCLVGQPEWTTTINPGDKIFDMPVTPVYVSSTQISTDPTSRIANYSPTMLAYISRAFCLWRGTLKLKIQVIKTQFHSGRLALVYDPHGTHDVNLTNFNYNKSHNIIIMDIQEQQELTIELPYFAIKPWLRCDRFRSDANLVDASGIINPSYLDCDVAGVFRIYCLNGLVRPDNVTDKIQINVLMYAGDNFELSVPNPVSPLSVRTGSTSIQYPNLPRYAWCKTGSDTICNANGPIYNLYYIGERLFNVGQITPGAKWYESTVKIASYDSVSFVYSCEKIAYFMETATGPCADLINSFPTYAKQVLITEDISNMTENIQTGVNNIDDKTETLAYNTRHIYSTVNDLSRVSTQINNTTDKILSHMTEQGLENYTTTRDNDGTTVTITDGNNKSTVAPYTVSENGMNLQTLLRRYYPLWVSGDIFNTNDFTIISIPVSPSFAPDDTTSTVVSGIDRRYDVHNLAWFARLYTFSRGSMRYKIAVNTQNADIYVWHNPIDTKTFRVSSGFNFEHLTEQMSFATDLAITQVQQGLEVEVPFYSTFNQLLHSHVTEKADLRATNGTLFLAVRNSGDQNHKLNVSIFVSTGDDFFLNVLRAPPVVHEPYLYPYVDSTVSEAIMYPELQKSLGHTSSSFQIPGTAPINRYSSGSFDVCKIPDAPENFNFIKLQGKMQHMEEQMFSIKDYIGVKDVQQQIKETFNDEIKPTVDNINDLTTEARQYLSEFQSDVLPQILGHGKLLHKDIQDSHDTIKEFIPKIEMAMEHLNAFMIGAKNTTEHISIAADAIAEASNFMSWLMKTLLISSIWLNVLQITTKFTWTSLINIVCLMCSLFKIQAGQIVQWLYANANKMYEDYRSKATNGAMSEQSFEEFIDTNSEELSLALAAVATVLYCALFGSLPSWEYIVNAVKSTVEKPRAKEQGLAESMRKIHFSNMGFKAINNSFDFFKEWIDKIIAWFLGTDCKEIMLEKQFKERAEQIQNWMKEVEDLEDEDLYQLSLSDIEIHNRFYALVDKGNEFTRWLLTEGVSKNVSQIIRDVNKRLMDMIKRIKKISPGHGFRYAPFTIMLDGESGVAKSNMMHKFTDMIRDELKIPYYNSVCTVPKTKEFLDGYEGQAIVEWDDVLQCPKQDEMVAEFINWRSNAECIINKAHIEEKGTHFTSKAIIFTTNHGEININTIRDMNAFRNRINLKFMCKLAPGFTSDTLKTMKRDSNFGFARLDAYHVTEHGSRYELLKPDLTLPEAIWLSRQHLQAWNLKQNEMIEEFMSTHGSMRIPPGVHIEVGEEQGYIVRLGDDLDAEQIVDGELFKMEFEEADDSYKELIYTKYQQIKHLCKKNSKKYWSLIKQKFVIVKNKFVAKIKELHAKYPTLVKALGIISAFTVAGMFCKGIYNMFQSFSMEKEEMYETVVRTPVKIIRAENAYETTVQKVPTKLVRAEYFENNVKVTPKLVKAEGLSPWHLHTCVKCNQKYEHLHYYRNPNHRQFPDQCPYPLCEWYHQGDNPTKSRFIEEEIKEEGTNDLEAINLARDKIHPLISNIGWEEPMQMSLMGLSIGGKILLAPHHFFRRAKKGDFFYYMRGSDKILIEFVPERMVRIRDKDAVLYYMGAQFDSRKDIVNCFVKEEHLSILGKSVSAVLMGTTRSGIMMEKACRAKANVQMQYSGNDEGAPTYIQHGWQYDIHTVSGECGSILIACDKRLPPPAKIIGIHTAGFSTQVGGFSIVLTREMVQEALDKIISLHGKQVYGAPLPPQVSQDEQAFEQVKLIPEGSFSIYGVMDKKFCPSQPHNTCLRPTPYQGQLYDISKRPAMLTNNGNISPLRKALSKYGKITKTYSNSLIKIVRADILNELMTCLPDMQPEPTDDEVAIFGIDGLQYCEKINFKSSPGWPYQCLKKGEYGKAYLFDVDNRKIRDACLQNNYIQREDMAKRGERYPSIWRDCLKDELRPLEKVQTGSTRLFTIGPVDYTLLVRKYFLAFEQAFYKNHCKFFSAVGINPESFEWTAAYDRLRTMGNKCVAGDFTCYDGTLMADIMYEIGEVIDDWYKLQGETCEYSTIVRKVLIDEMIHTYQLVQNCVYKTHQGNPSGNPLTVILNTIANCFYMRLTWMEIMQRENPQLATMIAYHQNVIDEAYGDDNRLVISDKVIEIFNQISITKQLATHGIIYTDELKTGELKPFKELLETSFLKRTYRYDNEIGKEIILPVMQKETIYSLTNWYRDATDVEEQLLANQRAALDFAFFHGRDFYDTFNKNLVNKMRQYNFNPLCLTYDEQLNRFLAMAHGNKEGIYSNFVELGF
uniref:Genome polyprotein n=1 Tax=Beijing Picor tick virus 1 TaxID=2972306 RepID=A0A9E8AAE4_9PICO|nr:MAG: polyprotein [Beijing Picor tick virus 1]